MVENTQTRADALVCAARDGDSRALGALFELYQNYIQFLAATQIRPQLRLRASASDVVQETFLHAHRGFSEFRGTSAREFVGWLKSILSRRIQHVRQQHLDAQQRDVRREVSLAAIGHQLNRSTYRLENVLVDRGPKPDSQVQHKERAIHVANALSELPKEYREVLTLRCVDGLPFSDIAESLERSPGAARMLFLRGIQNLRDRLKARGQL